MTKRGHAAMHFVAADEFVEAVFVRSEVDLKVSGSIRQDMGSCLN